MGKKNKKTCTSLPPCDAELETVKQEIYILPGVWDNIEDSIEYLYILTEMIQQETEIGNADDRT